MNPVEGVKRMFTLDALIELLKAVAEDAPRCCSSAGSAVTSLLPELALLPHGRHAPGTGGQCDLGRHQERCWCGR